MESILGELRILLFTIPILLCYNLSATYLTANLVIHARIKHVKIDNHFVHERVANHIVCVHFLPFEDQLADYMIKPLPTQRFLTLCTKLIVLTRPMILRGDDKNTNL